MAQEGSLLNNSPKFSSPEEELAYLRARVLEQEKKHEWEGVTYNREEIIKEKVEEHRQSKPENILKHPLNHNEREEIVLDLSPKGTDKKIEELLGLLDLKGILNTLTIVEKLNDPQLEDDFHRVLVQYIKKNLPVSGLAEKSSLFASLHMTLFEIALSVDKPEEKKPLKEIVSSMEQLYAGIIPHTPGKINEWLSFEIAVSNDNREVVFYAAVPDRLCGLFEKQLLSIFPQAKIREEKNDYNIFKDKGHYAASYATYKENPVFRLKYYSEFDYDPLTIILNAFSKIAEEGEGAAIQYLIAPPKIDYLYRYKNALIEMDKGTPGKVAIDIRESLIGDFSKDIGGLLKDMVKVDNNKKEEYGSKGISEEDNQIKEAIKQKTETGIVSVGIRLVTSAGTMERAEAIISEIEAAYHQFEETSGNALIFKRYQRHELAKLTRDFSFRVFEKDEALPMSLRELSTIFHLPTESAGTVSELRQSKAGTAPIPTEMKKAGILLGINRHRNQASDVYFSPEDRLRHFYCIGQTGTGKSTLLKNMIVQDIKNGDGVCMIDPHGSDIEDVLASVPHSRLSDVIYFDPAYSARPMGLNMLEFDPRFPEQKTFVVNELIAIFNKLFDMKIAGGPAFEQYFRNSALLVMEDPASGNTIIEIGRVLADKAFRDLKLSRCKNPIVAQFWQNAEKTSGEQSLANFVPYITSKLDPFISNDIMRPVIAQEKSSFNFRDIMDSKKILLVNLSKGRLGDINANFIGLILIGKILMAALSRVDSLGKNLPPFYLYIDEFQNITTDSISSILSEARKYKLSLTIAHQFIAQLEEKIRDAVFGNVGSLAAFRVGSDDAEYLSKQFEPTFTEKQIMNLDNANAYLRLLVGGRPSKPFNLETISFPNVNRQGINALKEISYLKYGKARAEIEENILSRYKKTGV